MTIRLRKVNRDMRIGDGKLPEWLKRLSEKIHKDGHMPEIADQVIVNEYLNLGKALLHT